MAFGSSLAITPGGDGAPGGAHGAHAAEAAAGAGHHGDGCGVRADRGAVPRPRPRAALTHVRPALHAAGASNMYDHHLI